MNENEINGAPVLLVCMLYILVMYTYIILFSSTVILVYLLIIYFNTGLFHGHSNLVCNLLNFVRWSCWSLWSSRRGHHKFYFIFILSCPKRIWHPLSYWLSNFVCKTQALIETLNLFNQVKKFIGSFWMQSTGASFWLCFYEIELHFSITLFNIFFIVG